MTKYFSGQCLEQLWQYLGVGSQQQRQTSVDEIEDQAKISRVKNPPPHSVIHHHYHRHLRLLIHGTSRNVFKSIPKRIQHYIIYIVASEQNSQGFFFKNKKFRAVYWYCSLLTTKTMAFLVILCISIYLYFSALALINMRAVCFSL